jgi:hypothetical protein
MQELVADYKAKKLTCKLQAAFGLSSEAGVW